MLASEANLSIVHFSPIFWISWKMSSLKRQESPALMRESWSATVFSSPQICCGIIEAFCSLNIFSSCYILFLRCSVDAKPFLIICTTPMLSVKSLMHLWLISPLTASMAAITASSSRAVEPLACYCSLNVLLANIVPILCEWHVFLASVWAQLCAASSEWKCTLFVLLWARAWKCMLYFF